MSAQRSEIDGIAFGLALGALGAATLAFFVTRNGAALVMCGLCLTGLLVGRLAGVPGPVLLFAALGLSWILWIVWVDPVASPRKTSAAAHVGGGALVGWALSEALRRRGFGYWPLLALAGVLALAIAWEIGELIGDSILGTALVPDRSDSAVDIFFGCAGGAIGVGFARLIAPRSG